jgi:hypothetical protein
VRRLEDDGADPDGRCVAGRRGEPIRRGDNDRAPADPAPSRGVHREERAWRDAVERGDTSAVGRVEARIPLRDREGGDERGADDAGQRNDLHRAGVPRPLPEQRTAANGTEGDPVGEERRKGMEV